MKRGSGFPRRSALWKAWRAPWDSATVITSGARLSDVLVLPPARIEAGLPRGTDDSVAKIAERNALIVRNLFLLLSALRVCCAVSALSVSPLEVNRSNEGHHGIRGRLNPDLTIKLTCPFCKQMRITSWISAIPRMTINRLMGTARAMVFPKGCKEAHYQHTCAPHRAGI
jgi:hypothetical protein